MAFTMRTSKPGAGNKFYITTSKGGYSTCIQGSPTDSQCNVLANCVGYACGRFNEIIGSMKYPSLNCNAEKCIERAKAAGLSVGNTPKVGAIMWWMKGSTLSGSDGKGIDFQSVLDICKEIKECKDLGCEIGIVVGGGNFWRGRSNQHMDRCTADHIGMLATTMNALALQDGFKQIGCESRVQTGIEMRQIAEFYIKNRAVRHMEKDRIVIFGCGTGSPFFSTDTAAALRAAEINADIIFKATNVDGVYTSDPKKDKTATKFDEITYIDVLNKKLNVMDSTATSLCMDNNIPILVFDINKKGNLLKAVKGETIGTIVK